VASALVHATTMCRAILQLKIVGRGMNKLLVTKYPLPAMFEVCTRLTSSSLNIILTYVFLMILGHVNSILLFSLHKLLDAYIRWTYVWNCEIGRMFVQPLPQDALLVACLGRPMFLPIGNTM
jgi:hypothetical protein